MLLALTVPRCSHQESEGQGCPFCRCEIKGTEPIVVDPFRPKPNGASFAGFQGPCRAEGNEEDEDDRLEDQHLVMSRLACSKVLEPCPPPHPSAVEYKVCEHKLRRGLSTF